MKADIPQSTRDRLRTLAGEAIVNMNAKYGPFIEAVANPLQLLALLDMADRAVNTAEQPSIKPPAEPTAEVSFIGVDLAEGVDTTVYGLSLPGGKFVVESVEQLPRARKEPAACMRRRKSYGEWQRWEPGTVADGKRVEGLVSWEVRWIHGPTLTTVGVPLQSQAGKEEVNG